MTPPNKKPRPAAPPAIDGPWMRRWLDEQGVQAARPDATRTPAPRRPTVRGVSASDSRLQAIRDLDRRAPALQQLVYGIGKFDPETTPAGVATEAFRAPVRTLQGVQRGAKAVVRGVQDARRGDGRGAAGAALEAGGEAALAALPMLLPATGKLLGGVFKRGARAAAAEAGAAGRALTQFAEATPEEFAAAIEPMRTAKPSEAPFITWRSPDEMRAANMRAFLSPDKKTGYALADLGGGRVDIRNVFNYGEHGAGSHAVAHALSQGGNVLDHFDTGLGNFYRDFGFQEYHAPEVLEYGGKAGASRVPFNREYAPEGWDFAKHGEPDVVFQMHPRPGADESPEAFLREYEKNRATRKLHAAPLEGANVPTFVRNGTAQPGPNGVPVATQAPVRTRFHYPKGVDVRNPAQVALAPGYRSRVNIFDAMRGVEANAGRQATRSEPLRLGPGGQYEPPPPPPPRPVPALRNRAGGVTNGRTANAANAPSRSVSSFAQRVGAVNPGAPTGRPPFYSRLERAIEGAPFEKGTGAQWRAALSKNVAAGEREWTGIDKLLADAGAGPVTKEQLRAAYDAGRVRLSERVLSEDGINRGSKYALPEVLKAIRGAGDANEALMFLENDGDAYRALTRRFPGITEDDASHWATTVFDDLFPNGDATSLPRHSYYQEPGGTNYREVLLKTDTKRDPRTWEPRREPGTGRWKVVDAATGQEHPEYGDSPTYERAAQSAVHANAARPAHLSGHWPDDPNVAVHVRMNDRDWTPHGRALHLEEIQSDWHQDGRKLGYAKLQTTEELDALRARRAEMYQRQDALDQETRALSKKKIEKTITPEEEERFWAASRELRALDDEIPKVVDQINGSGVPDGPLKRTEEWAGLGLKRAIDEAVRGGRGAISWTPGRAQTDRYADYVEHGMQGFYDRMLPSIIKEYGKKMGTALEILEPTPRYPFPAFRIPDALRDKVLQGGQPLWSLAPVLAGGGLLAGGMAPDKGMEPHPLLWPDQGFEPRPPGPLQPR